MAFNGTTAEDIRMAATGWRKRQIYDRQMRSMQDQESDLQEPTGSHEGHWPQEALSMLGLSSPAQTRIALLRAESVVDVLCGRTSRRDDRLAGPGSRESVVNTRDQGETK